MKKVVVRTAVILFALALIAMGVVTAFFSGTTVKAKADEMQDIIAQAARRIGVSVAKRDATDDFYNSTAKGMATISADSGDVIYSKNMHQTMPMASTTKIFTAITVIENVENLDELITIPKQAVGIEGTSLYLEEGEELTVRELLYGLMLRSANDAAVALAIHTSGSVKEFCELMEQTAKKCGALNSSFKNPHGLDEDGHYTTAYDLAVVSAYALKNSTFKEIVSTKRVTMPRQGRKNERIVLNKNRLLSSLEGCIGVKTGFTRKAGRCYVGATERDGFTYVSVVLNCGPMFEEAADMLSLCNARHNKLPLIPISANLIADEELTNI